MLILNVFHVEVTQGDGELFILPFITLFILIVIIFYNLGCLLSNMLHFSDIPTR
jgi:hypothetical protein